MSTVFFDRALATVASFWRVYRRDGVATGFTGHDRDLRFSGVLHRAAPGMLPSAIRLSDGFARDLADVQGALTHDGIDPGDLAAGRYDGARVLVGAVDWETLEEQVLFAGAIGQVSREDGRFRAELSCARSRLEEDPVPRTSPVCRALFCGPGCTLSAARFTREAVLDTIDAQGGRLRFAGIDPALYVDGGLRWLDGPQAGLGAAILSADGAWLIPDRPLDPAIASGTRARLREGCDHTIATCSARFGNAVNFQGEPFLPGNDMLMRRPRPGS